MKMKIGLVIFVVVCAGLIVALVAVKKTAEDRSKDTVAAMLDFSNQLVNARDEINGLSQVNLVLTNDLGESRQESLDLSNKLAEAKLSIQTDSDQIAGLNGRITDLEKQNELLDQRAAALTNTIALLDEQIADSEQKLAAMQTNDAFLTAELQRQMDRRAELEHKFNDLDALRTQVKKVRNDLFVAQRLEWMRNGTDPSIMHKGGQLLMQHAPATNAAPAAPSHYDLNVEVGSDGSVHVIPPTNAPAANSP
jgi:chromosome segregation ATPase